MSKTVETFVGHRVPIPETHRDSDTVRVTLLHLQAYNCCSLLPNREMKATRDQHLKSFLDI